MLSAIFNRANSCKHGKHRILSYTMYIYTNISFILWIYMRSWKTHRIPTIKVQHRNMLGKKPVNIHIIQSVRRIVTCCYCCMFLNGWKVCQILHNQVQRSEFTQPRVLLNAANVMDAAAYSLSTV